MTEKQRVKQGVLNMLKAGPATIDQLATAICDEHTWTEYRLIQRVTNELCKKGWVSSKRVGGWNDPNLYTLDAEIYEPRNGH